LRIKEQETRLTLREHDDDDDGDVTFFMTEKCCFPSYRNFSLKIVLKALLSLAFMFNVNLA